MAPITPTRPLPVTAEGFGYRHAGRSAPALSDVTFHIEPGEKVLLLGPSGAGKSTLLAALGGVLGTSEEDGEATGRLVAGRPGEVGMVLQDPESQTIYTRVGDDVAFGCENLSMDPDEIWPRVRQALDMVGLDVPLHHPTAQLSGGQKQRLALAGVIAMGAGLILLDEPTANLDPAGADAIVEAVIGATDTTGATLVIVEHHLHRWLPHIDRVIVLDAGGVVTDDGPVDQVLRRNGSRLAAQGVWVPGVPLDLSPAASAPTPCAPTVGHDNPEESAGDAVALAAQHVQCSWDGHTPQGVVHNLGLRAGTTTAITGPNGAGKSTLALTLAGLLTPLSGSVVAAPDVACGAGPHPHDWDSRTLAGRIAYVFQDPEAQFVARSVREELLATPKAVLATRGLLRRRRVADADLPQEITDRADELLARLRLDHLANANPFTLSGGQKRRLSVATALINTPQVVLLDEPTFGQDRTTFIDLVRLLQELTRSGATVAAITHDPVFVDAVATHHIEVTAG